MNLAIIKWKGLVKNIGKKLNLNNIGDGIIGVRFGKSLDIMDISKVHAKSWRVAYKGLISQDYLNKIYDTFWTPKFSQIFQRKDYNVAVYEKNGEITGCITFGKEQDFVKTEEEDLNHINNMGEVVTFYVVPECWGEKQGYLLMNFALENMKKEGYVGCYVWVLESNERGKNFYRRYGFTEEKIHTTSVLQDEVTTEVRYYIKF